MIFRSFAALAVLVALCGPAGADEAAPPTTLPMLALNPEAPPPQTGSQKDSPWKGFYVGTEVMGAFSKGSKGRWGGAAYAGYNREFDNNLVIGIDAKTGYAPAMFGHSGFNGFNFAQSDVTVGYDMGRFMPFVTAGVGFVSPDRWGGPTYMSANDSLNDLFSSGSALSGYGTVGAGFDYAINNNLSFGVAVSASHGRGPFAP